MPSMMKQSFNQVYNQGKRKKRVTYFSYIILMLYYFIVHYISKTFVPRTSEAFVQVIETWDISFNLHECFPHLQNEWFKKQTP